jgi:4-aminobutyrate aminotransferase-like enzyme
VDQEALLELARKHLIRYASEFAPFVVSRAEGSWIWDQDGNRYLDFTSGQICSTIGHNPSVSRTPLCPGPAGDTALDARPERM